MTTSAQIRSQLVDALQLDLVGPTPSDTVHAEEILTQAPSKWYLTGFLAPYGVPTEARSDDTANDELDELADGAANEDNSVPEAASARNTIWSNFGYR